MKRGYYVCTKCGWQVEKGRVDWGLVELAEVPSKNHVMEKCGECGSLYRNDIDEPVCLCPDCDTVLECVVRDIVKDSTPQIMGAAYKVPIHSDSLAISPDQVAEHKKEFPNIEIDDQCRPVFTNAKDHQAYMNKCGITKQTQKIGRGKSKIYSYPGSKCS